MRNWTTKESRRAVDWALGIGDSPKPLPLLAQELQRTPEAIKEFLRRVIPREQWPWGRRPRWDRHELDGIRNGVNPNGRSNAAVRKHFQRKRRKSEAEPDHEPLTVSQVAKDLGLSRTTVHRFLSSGLLRRFKGGIAESSFEAFLREHPERIPYETLTPDHREWLVLNGFNDPDLAVRPPSVRGLLE